MNDIKILITTYIGHPKFRNREDVINSIKLDLIDLGIEANIDTRTVPGVLIYFKNQEDLNLLLLSGLINRQWIDLQNIQVCSYHGEPR